MLPLGHMGITFAIVGILEKFLRLKRIDYRLLLVGALLPDLIDKSLGYLLSAGHMFGGKGLGHSFAFLLLLLGIGLTQRRKQSTATMRTLFLGSAIHNILDTMWRFPTILFWPIGGWIFSEKPYGSWEGIIRFGTHKISKLMALEVIGGMILLYFFIRLATNNKVTHFIRTGRFRHHEF